MLVGVSFCFDLVFCLFFFFPLENERAEEKEQEEENLWFFVPGTKWQYVYVE